jgi:hypothetical protein
MKFSSSAVAWQAVPLLSHWPARDGSVTLIEREPTPRHKVCGEFLSGEALEDLRALGIDVDLAWSRAHQLRSPGRCQARRGGSVAFSRSLADAQGA